MLSLRTVDGRLEDPPCSSESYLSFPSGTHSRISPTKRGEKKTQGTDTKKSIAMATDQILTAKQKGVPGIHNLDNHIAKKYTSKNMVQLQQHSPFRSPCTQTLSHLLSTTRQSCRQNSKLRSNGVKVSISFSWSRARDRRHSRKLSLSLSSSCLAVVVLSHGGLKHSKLYTVDQEIFVVL